jgi:hypothetical protein
MEGLSAVSRLDEKLGFVCAMGSLRLLLSDHGDDQVE